MSSCFVSDFQTFPLFLPSGLHDDFIEANKKLKESHIIIIDKPVTQTSKKSGKHKKGNKKNTHSSDPESTVVEKEILLESTPTYSPQEEVISITLSDSQKQTIDEMMAQIHSQSKTDVPNPDNLKGADISSGVLLTPLSKNEEAKRKKKWSTYTVVQLKEILKNNNLETCGTKNVLIQKLLNNNIPLTS